MNNKRKEIESLIDKAAQAWKSEDALRFSQAALNSAHATATLDGNERANKEVTM